MNKILFKIVKHFIALSFALFFLGGEPVEFGQEKTFFHGYLIQKPIIRIGLGINLGDVKIASSSGMKIYEAKTNYKLIADDVDEVFLKGHKEKLNEKFIVQVTQSEDREEAELYAQDLRTRFDNYKVYVVRSNEEGLAGAYQVRVGDFLTRGDALNFIQGLSALGIKDTWIIKEEITDESRPLWILVNDELKSLDDETVLYFIPSNPQSFLSFKGRDYKGIFILQATRKGVVLVNLLHMEDYLKSVVPSELSPYNFRELEAHKAQAVAARTYAIKNLGLHDDLGFDLWDTPQSQFYKGINAEHPLSTRAVEETRGEVAVYRGKLIDALYTSTCGGKTANVENVFQGPALPYLRSTTCVYEDQKEWPLSSDHILRPVYIDGRNIAYEIAQMISLDILEDVSDPLFYMEEASIENVLGWTQGAMEALGKSWADLEFSGTQVDYLTLGELIIQAFDWESSVDNLLMEKEKEYLLKDLPEVEPVQQGLLAYLIQTGIYPSKDELQDPQKKLLRGEVILALFNVLANYENFYHEGEFKGIEQDHIIVDNSAEDERFLLSPETFLVKKTDTGISFSNQVYLLGGENIRWIEQDGKLRLLEIDHPQQTNLLDRSSIYHSWKVRRSLDEVERRINQFYPVGKLIDIAATKRGASNRVIELAVNGQRGSAIVRGLHIRNILSLRDNLFVIERERDDVGDISHFIFTGRGWGHGVGLCQVGAFGMAQAGAGYKEILQKYYKNIKIDKIY